ncbi:MAG: hypothetical protein LAP61_23995 [Acidobacteriia bacterium]|nr:hypothetical protein [Terriglobia bacterium]
MTNTLVSPEDDAPERGIRKRPKPDRGNASAQADLREQSPKLLGGEIRSHPNETTPGIVLTHLPERGAA